jgi:hypothetical protein
MEKSMASKSSSATEKRVNKSKAILKYFKSHPGVKPRQIVAALNRRGLDINAQYVSTILFNHRKRTDIGDDFQDESGAPQKTVGLNATGVSAREIMLAKQLVKQSGSIGAARKALEMYGDIIA